MINTETGRKLPRPAGGEDAIYPISEHQPWKDQPGIVDLLVWCVISLHVCPYDGFGVRLTACSLGERLGDIMAIGNSSYHDHA